ncbi:hypothetical protein [Curvibacter delicatus]|jgi:hypothetical protein|uniref:hypothetical protein n=1 Tax=Curvibacter delicatus TaxID=80879 RepID=UPI000834A32A|nr:hypothetical protein [Curvibacter delicatus]
MEIILGIIAVLALLILIGKIKGSPSPKEMSDEAIVDRLRSENAWIAKYQALPIEHRQGAGLKKQHDDKQRYIMELMLELTNRHGDKQKESLAPAMQRAYELIRQGVPEDKAQEQAIAEYVADRDARQAKVKEAQQ